MHVLAIRRPGQRGTQKLAALYGDRLVCVRYRYDAASGARYKTVELIVDQAAWGPAATASARPQAGYPARPYRRSGNTVAATGGREGVLS